MRSSVEALAGPEAGDATRHLCAAAIRDPEFRAKAIRELVENQHRVPAPTPGVDSARVLEECLLIRRASLVAGAAFLGIGLLGLAISWIPMILVVFLVIILRIIIGLVGSLLEIMKRRFGRSTQAATKRRARWFVWLIAYIVVGFAFALFSVYVQSSDQSFSDWVLITIPLWMLVGAAHRYWRRAREHALLDPRRPATAGESFPTLRDVFARLRSHSSEVDTVYGKFSPFAGSGIEVHDRDWSYAIELRPNAERRDEGRSADAMEAHDLHHRIAAGLARLGEGSLYPGDPLRRLVVGDRLFRSGWRIDPWQSWFGRLAITDPGTGRPALRPDWADLLDLAAHERLRHYLEARVELWGYQVVASVFLRVHVQGELLQLDGLATVLPPIAEDYRAIDELPPGDPAIDALVALGWGIIGLPNDLVGSVVEAIFWLRSIVRTYFRKAWYRQMIGSGRVVDHSPQLSLRELGADLEFQQRFQKADVDRFFQSVRRRAVSVVQQELRVRGYDTKEFDQIIQTINNGIQNFNSTVTGPQAAGPHAGAVQHVETPPAQIGV